MICVCTLTILTNAQSQVVTPTSPTPTNNYLARWTNGSIYQIESGQLYDNGTSVGLGTTSPLGKFHIEDGAVLFKGTTGGTPTSGAGVRLMWVPDKAAFRAGEAYNDYWDSTNIGTGSMASGYITKAMGHYTFAYGYDCEALGLHSFSGGHGNRARADGSIALGSHNSITSTSNESIAIGSDHTIDAANALALGFGSYVTGQNAVAINGSAAGNYSYAIGGQTLASGTGAVALGNNNTAAGNYSLALGSNSDTKTYTGCFVFSDAETFLGAPPVENTANNQFVTRATGGYIVHTDANLDAGKAFVFGNNQQFHIGQDFKFENNEFRSNLKINPTYSSYSSGIYFNGDKGGFHAGHTSFMNNANVGYFSNSLGLGNFTEGNFQNAFGRWNIIHTGAQGSSAIGNSNVINGIGVHASGNSNAMNGDSSMALGNYNTTSVAQSMVLGNYASDNGYRGSMVMSDASVPVLFGASSDQQFNLRATGGVRIFTDHNLPTSNIFTIAPSSGYLGLGVATASERLEVDGRIKLIATSAPSTTTDKLYNVSGNLYWNGSNLTAGSLPGGSSNQTLRYNGSNWVASSVLQNNGTNIIFNGNILSDATSSSRDIGSSAQGFNSAYYTTQITPSDSKLKNTITKIENATDLIIRLNPVTYYYNKNPNVKRYGLIAQEVEPIIPELVIRDSASDYCGLNYMDLISILIKSAQEQNAELISLRQKVTELSNSLMQSQSKSEISIGSSLLSITPNPNNGVFSVVGSWDSNQMVQFKISDASGKQIIEIESMPLDRANCQLNLIDLLAGGYFLSASQNGKFLGMRSFIISR